MDLPYSSPNFSMYTRHDQSNIRITLLFIQHVVKRRLIVTILLIFLMSFITDVFYDVLTTDISQIMIRYYKNKCKHLLYV